MSTIEQEFISPKEAARLTGFTYEGLRRMRRENRGPCFYKPPGQTKVLYKKAEVLAWMNEGRRIERGPRTWRPRPRLP